MVLGRSTMVSGRCTMVLGRSTMVLERSTMVSGRSTLVLGRSTMVLGRSGLDFGNIAQTKTIFKASALWADAFYKSKCQSVCPSVCPSVCLFTFEVPFNGLFAPTSRSRMSNIFRDLESLGESNGKKWSQI